MFLTKNFKIIITLFLIMLFEIKNVVAVENKILFKVDNEIITTIDIFEEIKFLKSFNPEMNSLSKTELFEISKNSLLKNKIKKIEIMKFVKEFKVEDKFLQNIIKNKYSKIGINSLENFKSFLKDNSLDFEVIREKLTTELIWNDLIYQKFNKKIVIDRDKIKNEILQNSQKENQIELLLSEISFSVNDKVDFQDKYQKILLDIENIGFKKTALVHSKSETATNGGVVGWVNENTLNKNVKKTISELQIGQISKPIRTSSGFIILRIDDKRESVLKLNLNEKIEEIIRFKTNDQLDQFSNIYFNKVKKDLIIYGL
tara:strand:+ start:2144 stop:3088 length:945 start_codon:yes stop_codon:yes gene_type:complete